MKRYVVRMINDCGCEIDSDIINAENDSEVIAIFKDLHNIIEYAGDKFIVEEY